MYLSASLIRSVYLMVPMCGKKVKRCITPRFLILANKQSGEVVKANIDFFWESAHDYGSGAVPFLLVSSKCNYFSMAPEWLRHEFPEHTARKLYYLARSGPRLPLRLPVSERWKMGRDLKIKSPWIERKAFYSSTHASEWTIEKFSERRFQSCGSVCGVQKTATEQVSPRSSFFLGFGAAQEVAHPHTHIQAAHIRAFVPSRAACSGAAIPLEIVMCLWGITEFGCGSALRIAKCCRKYLANGNWRCLGWFLFWIKQLRWNLLLGS